MKRGPYPKSLAFATRVWEKHVRAMCEKGMTHRAIAKALNEDGVRTVQNRSWHKSQVTRLIKRIQEFRTREEAKGECWALLREERAATNTGETADLSWLVTKVRALDPCLEVTALGLSAQRHRMQGHLGEAGALLERAWRVSGDCRSCHADLYYREAHLLRAQGDYRAALEAACRTQELYRDFGASHDLSGVGFEKSFCLLGQLRWFLKDFHGSAKEFEICLQKLVPEKEPDLYICAIHGFAVALADCGHQAQSEAVGILRGVRRDKFMRRYRRRSMHVAYFDWLEGVLKYKLRIGLPSRARSMVEDGLVIFIERKMREESVAVVSDLSCMAVRRRDQPYPDRNMILDLLERFQAGLRGLELELDARRRLAELREACDRCGWDACRGITTAIRNLRRAASGSRVLPCLF